MKEDMDQTGKTLKSLLQGLKPLQILGSTDIAIEEVIFDSRKAGPNKLFVAVKGVQVDGHQFIPQVLQANTRALIVETIPENVPDQVTIVQVANSAQALGFLSAAFYEHPSHQLNLVGVTGTNGKTTTVTLLYDLFSGLGFKCGLLSTVENRIAGQVIASTHTTPDAVAINALLAQMVEAGCEYAFMEVSSHAVDQGRIAGLDFKGAIFTNITHDHLDYHKTFDNYIRAKKAFFDQLSKKAFALVNVDDKRGMVMTQNTVAAVHRYSLRQMAEFRARIIENSLTGLHLDIDNQDFYGRLIGEFNAYNLLAVYATAILLEQDKVDTLTQLSQLKAAEGRFDYVLDAKRKVTAIVDYAHTPDALEKVLETIQSLRKADAKVLTVVGCGGDRDRTKRPTMAKVACQYSDQVILTSDNPRSEEPEAIIREMEAGVPAEARRQVLSIIDRKEAIRTACRLAQNGDVVLVAGKGHEKYQEIKGVKHPFDDKEILNEEFSH
ncbi:MAG: UDP-N-acetylmuramoyl-L-alanyl-D-glutamate--2,6-diaminopimelate ligase [Haliscomenobacter sp.]|uniref:UDP-N-acetylmuramoyl-L-alanyl-D-glutamate--2, 6-diaminopimelate ligase n=1 Tax=Haliscomenobacter sp. TaxID=2717303 RepID=UPI0029AAF175|nr:UDP-N-acetylmuramoyl-L-alanyl-D-glutamate--2,6-diaminopimelate ligase [Haliscomenobacter sp.]MDX2072356.1 UDP-N-acetylmuramoyl-L-alanyl-D-glutamate--2,6-diaminopimelate ligase [Haliscomenobacter sp.]